MNITVKNLQKRIPIHPPQIIRAAQGAIKALKIKQAEISIVFMGEQRMRRINKEYLGHDYVTDVITFNSGEILICPLEAEKNARHYKNSVSKELMLYVIHGILHLAGYDDHRPEDILIMRKKEEEILSSLRTK